MTNAELFRTCPRTGLQFHKSAETLIKLNAVAAVLALLLGGIIALLITLTRWQAVHLLNAENFYMFLTAHGLDMLVIWIIFFCSSTSAFRPSGSGMVKSEEWHIIGSVMPSASACLRTLGTCSGSCNSGKRE